MTKKSEVSPELSGSGGARLLALAAERVPRSCRRQQRLLELLFSGVWWVAGDPKSEQLSSG